METPLGKFHCPDFAGPSQFWPSWERKVREVVETNKGLFIDVGANIGFYSILAAKKGNKVIAFEPNFKAFLCLQDNIKANGLQDRITAFNWAGWSETGFLKLKEGRHTDVSQVAEEGTTVLGMALDEVLKGEVPSMIKIDAEGSEAKILEGARNALKYNPKVVFEALDASKLTKCISMLPQSYWVKALDRTNYLAY